MSLKSLCVFCGANVGNKPVYQQIAVQFGKLLAKEGITLIYGGGNVGLMGIIADSVLETGGKVMGVIPQGLADKEVAHAGLTQLYVVKSMHERKQLMCDLSDAFVALPGGLGTFDELCEILTWNQLGIIAKPTALLNVEGYFNHLILLLDHCVQEGFLKEKNRGLLLTAEDQVDLLEKLNNWQPDYDPK